MTARDLGRGTGHDHRASGGHQRGPAGVAHGGHHWMMLACCVPMIIIVLALVAAGTISVGFVLFAVLCVGMMALMTGAMDHGSGR